MPSYKGYFKPTHPEKYKGDPTNIIFRSLWERKVMVMLDTNINVLEWASEEIIVPYLDPTTGRVRRYYPDFLVRMRKPDMTEKTVMIEVKPKKQTTEPIKRKRVTKQYITEVTTWATNQAKWKYAQDYCSRKGWEFQIITEDDIFGSKHK